MMFADQQILGVEIHIATQEKTQYHALVIAVQAMETLAHKIQTANQATVYTIFADKQTHTVGTHTVILEKTQERAQMTAN